jgi:hypothetical protein
VWESHEATHGRTCSERWGLSCDVPVCPPVLAMGQRAAFGETYIVKIAETFESYL